jgi:hypothetical protein
MKKFILVLVLVLIFLGGCTSRGTILLLNSTPTGASVYINDNYEGVTPLEKNVNNGEYQVVIKKEGFKDFEQNVSVGNGSGNINIDAKLEAIATFSVNLDFESHYTIFVDDKFMQKVTPATIQNVESGIHKIRLVSTRVSIEKDINVDKALILTEENFSDATYRWVKSSYGEVFANTDIKKNEIDSPILSMIPRLPGTETSRTYSDIFANDNVVIFGFTTEDTLYLVFPSGKKVKVDVSQGNGSEYVNIFSKEILFNEIGTYKFFTDSGDYPIATFDVLYRVVLISPDIRVKRLFNYTGDDIVDNSVAIPYSGGVSLKLYVTDGKGSPVKNKSIGMYNLKTDPAGMVTVAIKARDTLPEYLAVSGYNSKGVIYGPLFGVLYDYVKFDKNGKLINSTLDGIGNIQIVYENGSVYVPFEILDSVFSKSGISLDGLTLHTKSISNKEFVDLTSGDILTTPGLSININDTGIEFDLLHSS